MCAKGSLVLGVFFDILVSMGIVRMLIGYFDGYPGLLKGPSISYMSWCSGTYKIRIFHQSLIVEGHTSYHISKGH